MQSMWPVYSCKHSIIFASFVVVWFKVGKVFNFTFLPVSLLLLEGLHTAHTHLLNFQRFPQPTVGERTSLNGSAGNFNNVAKSEVFETAKRHFWPCNLKAPARICFSSFFINFRESCQSTVHCSEIKEMFTFSLHLFKDQNILFVRNIQQLIKHLLKLI